MDLTLWGAVAIATVAALTALLWRRMTTRRLHEFLRRPPGGVYLGHVPRHPRQESAHWRALTAYLSESERGFVEAIRQIRTRSVLMTNVSVGPPAHVQSVTAGGNLHRSTSGAMANARADVASDEREQISQTLDFRSSVEGHLILVIGAEPAVGCTVVATNLAIAFAQLSPTVLVTTPDVADELTPVSTIDSDMPAHRMQSLHAGAQLRHHRPSGLSVLPCESLAADEPSNGPSLIDLVAPLMSEDRWLIVDCGGVPRLPNAPEWLDSALTRADAVIYIVPLAPDVVRVRRDLKALGLRGVRNIGVVANDAGDANQMQKQ